MKVNKHSNNNNESFVHTMLKNNNDNDLCGKILNFFMLRKVKRQTGTLNFVCMKFHECTCLFF